MLRKGKARHESLARVRILVEIGGLNKMKKERIFIFWLLAIIIALVLLVFLKPQETISNIVQAIAIITLIFVTWVYAKRTKDLVDQEKFSLEEQKKKRIIDFWEKRITEFYKPFIDKLDKLKITMNKRSIDGKKVIDEIDDLRDFFKEKKYMISILKSNEIELLQDAFWGALLSGRDESMEFYKLKENEIRKIIQNDWDDIDKSIRKFYIDKSIRKFYGY